MAPYRARRESAPPPASPTTGLVADMVRQFADPYAFLRELVQNGIDAGATSLEVRIERAIDGTVATSVTDDGAGMSLETIQGPLLTLFESSKEGDSKKIGKYGVGFVSVFSTEPDEVQVTTWRDGQAWLVRLLKDHSYEVNDAGPREGSGTTVTLLKRLEEPAGGAAEAPVDASLKSALLAQPGDPAHLARSQGHLALLAQSAVEKQRAAAVAAHLIKADAPPRSALAEHEARAVEALRTWCRHAQCPIHITVVDHGSREEPRRARVDTPIEVVAPFSVTETLDDEIYVAGTSAGAQHLEATPEAVSEIELGETFAGFYNRGLTLYETQHPLSDDLRGIRFKVMSPHLQHTLSRDNVRRDEAFERVLGRVREIVKGALRQKLLVELARRAERAAHGEGEGEFAGALEAALCPAMAPDADAITLPLTDPVGGSSVLRGIGAHVHIGGKLLRGKPLLRGEPLFEAPLSNDLTRALAMAGTRVFRCSPARLAAALEHRFSLDIEAPQAKFALVTRWAPSRPDARDQELCQGVLEALAAAGEPVAGVGLCSIQGAWAKHTAVVVPDEGEGSRVFSVDELRRWWASFSRKHIVLLNASAGEVFFARKRGPADRGAAAILLARVLLLEAGGGPISPSANEKLLELAAKVRA
jgi:molecular chaperone HtpG